MNVLTPYERFKAKVLEPLKLGADRCWLWHDWGRWDEALKYKITRSDAHIGWLFTQTRCCKRCNVLAARATTAMIPQNTGRKLAS